MAGELVNAINDVIVPDPEVSAIARRLYNASIANPKDIELDDRGFPIAKQRSVIIGDINLAGDLEAVAVLSAARQLT